jgi:orotidine-5'-phosphate decarboxylase
VVKRERLFVALEIATARRAFPGALLVVPGIRPAGATVRGDDRARTATPGRVRALGADLLVVGRPVTRVRDPDAAADALVEEIGAISA